MKIVSITHREDADGIISQALILRRFRSDSVLLFHADHTNYHSVFKDVIERAKLEKPDLLIITDLSLKKGAIPYIEELKRMGIHIEIFDHHKWDKEVYSKIEKIADKLVIRDSERKACAEIIQEEFLPNDRLAKKLSGYAHGSDYPTNNTPRGISLYLDRAIANMITNDKDDDLKRTVYLVSDGKIDHELIKKHHDERVQLEEENMREMIKTLEKEEVEGKNIFFGASSFFHGKDACFRVLNELLKMGETPHLVVMFDPSVKQVTLVRRENDEFVDLSKFCVEMGKEIGLGGGGHPHRGGFGYKPKDEKIHQGVKRMIVDKIRRGRKPVKR
ncbi:MAG: hypothetical protein J7K68_02775 [Candidatus Diapherotrites archaeon]|nr:hypothetical protein [Candidatus Diapherotrites archaeon]